MSGSERAGVPGTGLARRLFVFVALFGGLYTVGALVPMSSVVWGGFVGLAAAVVAGAIMLRRDGRTPSALGFYIRPAALAEAGYGLVLGTFIAGVAVTLIAIGGGVRWGGEAGDVATWLVRAAGTLGLLALPAAAEEALFRGYPLQVLARERGRGVALWVTAAVFAIAHAWNPGVTPLGVANVLAAGLVLGVVYLRTGSLWWATGVHLGWNWALGFLADLPVSGLDLVDTPMVVAVVRGPEWLSGGAFGPEGSVLTAVALLGAAALLWRFEWLSPSRTAMEYEPLAFAGDR